MYCVSLFLYDFTVCGACVVWWSSKLAVTQPLSMYPILPIGEVWQDALSWQDAGLWAVHLSIFSSDGAQREAVKISGFVAQAGSGCGTQLW